MELMTVERTASRTTTGSAVPTTTAPTSKEAVR